MLKPVKLFSEHLDLHAVVCCQFHFQYMYHTFKVRYFLQCNHYIQPGQKTMHILSHHWCTRNLKLELFAWLNKWYHIDWIAKVGGDLLHKKGIKVEDYSNDLVELNFPLDTLGLLVIAHMFHNHVAIILKERIWTTQGNNDTDCCSIF